MATLSVVISVYNGQKYLEACLESVRGFADEIIVVDHDSTDDTVKIAKKFTKNIHQQKNNPDSIDIQKNYGFEKATADWILSLDADEKVTPELQGEIRKIISGGLAATGYRIPRKNIIFNKWIEHTGWYPDYQLRLFKTGKGKYTKKHVHEEIFISGNVEDLTSPLVHEAYQTIYQFLHRGLTVYAPNEAEALFEKGYTFSFVDILRFPTQEFLSRFFARKGYLDGFHGLALSLLMASYHLAVFLYIWEHEKFRQSSNSLEIFAEGVKNTKKELHYWTDTANLEKTKNPASKILLKTKRKLGL